LDADDELSEFLLKLDYQNTKVAALKEIIGQINNLKWVVRNHVELERWKHGG
jgi:hypothetical protein